MAGWKADRRLYLTEGGRAVREGEEGRWLLAPEGRVLSDADCRRYGIGPYASALPEEQSDAPEPSRESKPADPGHEITHIVEKSKRISGSRTKRR